MEPITAVFSVIVLVMSVVIHEVSHGYAALYLGDPTAKYEGRLTLNPFKHLDLMGSIIIPILTYVTGGFIFGWAKPVPFNPYNFKNKRWGELIVAIAGPISNLALAIMASLVINVVGLSIPLSTMTILELILRINVGLMVFNLLPIAPLDGSKVFYNLIPLKYQGVKSWLDRNSIFIFIIFIFVLGGSISYISDAIVKILLPF